MGWFVTTILVPVLAPNLVIWLWASWTHIERTPTHLAVVKDGQLCWAAIAFCASALYELLSVSQALDAAYKGILMGSLIVTLLASSFVAGGGAVFPAPVRPEGVSWLKHYKAMKGSFFLTAVSALLYSLVHFN